MWVVRYVSRNLAQLLTRQNVFSTDIMYFNSYITTTNHASIQAVYTLTDQDYMKVNGVTQLCLFWTLQLFVPSDVAIGHLSKLTNTELADLLRLCAQIH